MWWLSFLLDLLFPFVSAESSCLLDVRCVCTLIVLLTPPPLQLQGIHYSDSLCVSWH